MGLSIDAQSDALIAVLGEQPNTVGLFIGQQEIVDPKYQRQLVEFGAPQGDDTRYIENTSAVIFDDLARDQTIDHFGVFDALGNLRAHCPLGEERVADAEDNFKIKAGKLQVFIP